MYFLTVLKTYSSCIVIFIAAILLFQSSVSNAEEQLAQCFPSESAWDIVKLSKLPDSSNKQGVVENKQKLNISFRKNAIYLPRFYGFAYQKSDIQEVPKITSQKVIEKQFFNVNLTELDEDNPLEKGSGHYYNFTPDSAGTWVIYLVASLKKIPFLEGKGLRIHPDIERQRGGTVFTGSSLELAETIDYKACLIASKKDE